MHDAPLAVPARPLPPVLRPPRPGSRPPRAPRGRAVWRAASRAAPGAVRVRAGSRWGPPCPCPLGLARGAACVRRRAGARAVWAAVPLPAVAPGRRRASRAARAAGARRSLLRAGRSGFSLRWLRAAGLPGSALGAAVSGRAVGALAARVAPLCGAGGWSPAPAARRRPPGRLRRGRSGRSGRGGALALWRALAPPRARRPPRGRRPARAAAWPRRPAGGLVAGAAARGRLPLGSPPGGPPPPPPRPAPPPPLPPLPAITHEQS